MAQMPFPVAARDLCRDQPVGGLRVGDPEQRLGEAHENHPLLAGQAVFVHERVDAAELAAALAGGMHQRHGQRLDPALLLGREARLGDELLHQPGLVRQIELGDAMAWGELGKGVGENGLCLGHDDPG